MILIIISIYEDKRELTLQALMPIANELYEFTFYYAHQVHKFISMFLIRLTGYGIISLQSNARE